MFYRKVISFTGVVLMVYFSLGMAQATQKNTPSQDKINRTFLEEKFSDIEDAYDSLQAPSMMDLLDRDFEDYLGFKSSIDQEFNSVKSLQIHFVIDSFLTEADKVSVRLHWFKKTIDNTGAFSKAQGSSQFVFKKIPDGLKLLYLRGDNPFF